MCLWANLNVDRLLLSAVGCWWFVLDSCVQGKKPLNCWLKRSANIPRAMFLVNFQRCLGGLKCAWESFLHVISFLHILTVFRKALGGAKGLLGQIKVIALSLCLSLCVSSLRWLRASNNREHGRVLSLPQRKGKTWPGGREPSLNKQSWVETGTEASWFCPSVCAVSAL